MSRMDLLLTQLENAWSHKWESVQRALADVGEAQADWQPPCYVGEAREEGWPAPGSIRWQVAHMAVCMRHYNQMILLKPEKPAVADYRARKAFLEDVHALRTAHEALSATVSGLGEDELDETVSNGQTVAEFLGHCIAHLTWHSAQIMVARRMWNHREA